MNVSTCLILGQHLQETIEHLQILTSKGSISVQAFNFSEESNPHYYLFPVFNLDLLQIYI